MVSLFPLMVYEESSDDDDSLSVECSMTDGGGVGTEGWIVSEGDIKKVENWSIVY